MWGLLLVESHAMRACLCAGEFLHRGRSAGACRRHVRIRNRPADRHGRDHAEIAARTLTVTEDTDRDR